LIAIFTPFYGMKEKFSLEALLITVKPIAIIITVGMRCQFEFNDCEKSIGNAKSKFFYDEANDNKIIISV